MTFLEELEFRGMIKDITDRDLFKKLLDSKATIYCGFDPTAASLHIGHLVPVLMLRRFQQQGHRVIALVGAGTGLIGDPSGRKDERQLLTLETAKQNAEGIKSQLSRFLDFSDPKKTIMVSNYDWLKEIDVISFLRDYGKNFTINYMLAKDVVASRLENGISFTEFSYMILQSIDFYTLFKKEKCQIQMGGSDQWGNLTAGLELIRKIDGADAEAVAFTLPLITKSDGTKFGKSAGGALWLDADLTSPYAIYQYFLNSMDQDVIHYLKVFTFLTPTEINSYTEQVRTEPHLRAAQKRLAFEIVKLMHGETIANEAVMMSEVLFGGNVGKLSLKQLQECMNGVPTLELSEPKSLVEVIVDLGAASSRRDARELLGKGTYTVNGEKVTDINTILSKDIAIEGKMIVIRKSKKNYFIVDFK